MGTIMSTMAVEDLKVDSLDKTAGIVAAIFPSELGSMAVACREEVLCGIVFGHATAEKARAALARVLGLRVMPGTSRSVDVTDCPQFLHRLVDDLERFASGEAVDFHSVQISLDHLTPFGRRIVAACRQIPFGETRSYGQLATISGSPGAARAVGQVMAKNRFPLVVPCHRVLASGGRLGGFSAPEGLRMKRRLLTLESAPEEHHRSTQTA
jgi:methylated-DNA-[protein]-cysteine S-methyltransferase